MGPGLGVGGGHCIGGGPGCNHGTWTLGLTPWGGQPAVAPPPAESVVECDVPDHRPEAARLGLDPVTTRGGMETWAAEVQCGQGHAFLTLHPSTEDSLLSSDRGLKERGCLWAWEDRGMGPALPPPPWLRGGSFCSSLPLSSGGLPGTPGPRQGRLGREQGPQAHFQCPSCLVPTVTRSGCTEDGGGSCGGGRGGREGTPQGPPLGTASLQN